MINSLNAILVFQLMKSFPVTELEAFEKETTRLHLVATLRMRGAKPPLLQYAFMA
jgi:hypothetical protein